MNTHTFEIDSGATAPTGDDYDRTQWDDTIRDGDVLIVGSTIAILDRAWPIAIVGAPGAFHGLNLTDGWDAVLARVDADRATRDKAPLSPTIRRILAGEFTPARGAI